MPDDRALMRLHVDALFTHDARGRLLRVNEPDGGPAPRFFRGDTALGVERRFRHDLDDALVDALTRADDVEAATAILSRAAPVEHTWAGPAYAFPHDLPPSGAVRVTAANADLLRPHLEPWLVDVAHGVTVLASLHDGRAVAVCGSVRITHAAHEAGVETARDFRGRGHARAAVAAWAAAVREQGAAPLYSTSWENAASQALARSLGLRRFGDDLHIT